MCDLSDVPGSVMAMPRRALVAPADPSAGFPVTPGWPDGADGPIGDRGDGLWPPLTTGERPGAPLWVLVRDLLLFVGCVAVLSGMGWWVVRLVWLAVDP